MPRAIQNASKKCHLCGAPPSRHGSLLNHYATKHPKSEKGKQALKRKEAVRKGLGYK